MTPALEKLREIGELVTSNYDMTSRCNLRCEGCLFFSGDDYLHHGDDGDIETWDRFFAAEAERGVNFGYFAGAEPALEPERLRAASRHIDNGVILTNGTVRIARDLPYQVHVSVWGWEDTAAKLRGADTNRKALRNFAADPRAIFVMTLNPLNLDEAEPVAKACEDHGARLVFSLFSPTRLYLEQLAGEDVERDDFFRVSESEQNLRFDRNSLRKARDVILKLADLYPETVIAARGFYEWLCEVETPYDLDEDGIARNCDSLLSETARHFGADRKPSSGKCASPNLDCRECRAYAMTLGSYVSNRLDRDGQGAGARWREAMTMWAELFIGGTPADERP